MGEFDVFNVKSGEEEKETGWSEDLEGVPLKLRLKWLLASKGFPSDSATRKSSDNVVIKKENEEFDSQNFQSGGWADKLMIETGKEEQSHGENCKDVSPPPGFERAKIKNEIFEEPLDGRDQIVLKERLRILLKSTMSELKSSLTEDHSSALSSILDEICQRHAVAGKRESSSADKTIATSETHFHDIQESRRCGVSSVCGVKPLSKNRALECQYGGDKPVEAENSSFMYESDRIRSYHKKHSKCQLSDGQNLSSGSNRKFQTSADLIFANLKVEPSDEKDCHGVARITGRNLSISNMIPVKREQFYDSLYGDELDHLLLRDRMKLHSFKEVPHLSYGGSNGEKMDPSPVNCTPIASETAKELRVNRPRKRRRTATDSVEKAIEEDAPGLLQILIEKGVSINEMKLYGETESDDALDDSSTEGSFAELEALISKLFSQRHSLMKLTPIRCAKTEKISYCLACLFSLVEQARYLQFRKWPAEWGWCRDLQSFIFVFERHHRIVLERPEYGYATYFFELVDHLPVHWQIKRLVTAMKLTSCSRVALIENRALMIGEDLTEGEARVLVEYGWIPNTGLGTMLNYCDRVYHDRKSERDGSEWRSKIGKLLIDGYNSGTTVPADTPRKLMEGNVSQTPEIKLEII